MTLIVGSPRSGTTWLQRLLASHPGIYTGQESHLFEWYLGPMLRKWHSTLQKFEGRDETRREGVGLAAYLTTEGFRDLLRPFVEQTIAAAQVPPGGMFLEKTPGHALYMPEIAELWPGVRFVHLVRDPRDVVASLLKASESWGKGWAPENAMPAAQLWGRHVRAVRQAQAALPPDRFVEVRYEDLHAAPVARLGDLASFLGIEWDEADICEAVEANSASRTKAGQATPLPVFGHHGQKMKAVTREPEGFVGRARPGGGKHDLSFRQKVDVWRATRDLASAYGYAWTRSDWF